jgi:hypothetical protein
MFRSYDHPQAENILLARITQLTTDPLFSNIVNIIVIDLITGCLVDMVAVMLLKRFIQFIQSHPCPR